MERAIEKNTPLAAAINISLLTERWWWADYD